MVHKGVQLSVQQAKAGVWLWEYKIGQQIKSGELHASSLKLAVRKLHQKIDRELRDLYLLQRQRGMF